MSQITTTAAAWSDKLGKVGFEVGTFAGVAIGASAGGVIGGAAGYLDATFAPPTPAEERTFTAMPIPEEERADANESTANGVEENGAPNATNPFDEDSSAPEATANTSATWHATEEQLVVIANASGGTEGVKSIAAASERGGKYAIKGAEVGGTVTSVVIMLPFALVGGILGSLAGFTLDVAEYVRSHSNADQEASPGRDAMKEAKQSRDDAFLLNKK
eukprot:gnl/TRDRNA2_/TRDRNA2_81875_c0_seq1.p1 gnl/TRDRNA2_/TRDRNA2_81875_c0~~gnl/TRDRNA2_/TRDRNA2_81875_c0_seq1.p1  ORF type:complete len:218 (-),score=54.64 gnl/TRDRNA2_/TRDRNA2_81875_c0_seq1:47-700(-)